MLIGWSIALLPLILRLRQNVVPFNVTWHRGLRPRWVLTGRLISVGLSAGVEELSLSAGQLVFTRILTSLGTAVFAAHLIGFNLSGYGLNLVFGFAIAASTLVGPSGSAPAIPRSGARTPCGRRGSGWRPSPSSEPSCCSSAARSPDGQVELICGAFLREMHEGGYYP